MGDVGYFDEVGRFWYCGRKSHRVNTRTGTFFSEKIEAVFNSLPGVRRSALVGVDDNGWKSPAVVIEPEDSRLAGNDRDAIRRQDELVHTWYDVEPRLEALWCAEQGYTAPKAILFHPRLPVDVRHNAKINREQLALWVTSQLSRGANRCSTSQC
jgi:acyl-coenzyme A synthetase/AMP-(fatty) acid ligase